MTPNPNPPTALALKVMYNELHRIKKAYKPNRHMKLSPNDVQAIRQSKQHPKILAEKYKISLCYAYQIKAGIKRRKG